MTQPGAEPVLLEAVEDGVMTLTLNRPDKLNSFTAELHGLLRAALKRAADDAAVRVVLLTGAGRGFCAGQDLGARHPDSEGGAPDLGETIETLWNPLARAIRDLPKPAICAVNGVAAGAGANLALLADIVIAGESARFIQSFAKLGLVPDSGGTWTMTHRLGEARAKALMLTGEPLGAVKAEEWGLIWKAVPDESLMEEAKNLASVFASGPTFGYGLTKQAVHAAGHLSFDDSLDLERDLQRRAGRSADYAEGVRAFTEKRAPVFTGEPS